MPRHADIPTILSKTKIKHRVHQLAGEISQYYQSGKLVVVVIIPGGMMFAADLLRDLDDTLAVRVEFVVVGWSPDDAQPTMPPNYSALPAGGWDGAQVLILDVVHTPHTLAAVREELARRKAPKKGIRAAVLIQKKGTTQCTDGLAEHIGFEDIQASYLIGYGMDFNGKFSTYRQVGRLTDQLRIAVPKG